MKKAVNLNTKEYPFVSVIIPARNEEKNVGNCIKAIHSCGFPKDNFEVIVMDNGSSDGTVEIAERMGSKVFVAEGASIARLRNLGFKNSKGSIIGFVDCDCLVGENWIISALSVLQDEQNVACGAFPIVENNATWVQKTWEFSYVSGEKKKVDWLSSMNLFVKRNFFLDVGGFEESLITAEDVDLCYRLKQYGNIISDPKIQIVHLGEPRTLKAFYARELWQGHSNFEGIKKHGIVLGEIPSLLVPIYTLIVSIFVLLSIIAGNALYLMVAFCFFVLPSLVYSAKKSLQKRQFNFFFNLLVLYLTYSVARTNAMFIKRRYKKKR